MPGQRPDDGVNMIRHDDPRAQFVALANEEFQRTCNVISHVRPAYPTRTFARIEQRFDFITIPGDQALFLVPGERAFGGAGLFDNDAAFVFEPGDFVSGQGIVEPECNEINRAFFFQMRQLPAKMQTGNQWAWWSGIHRLVVSVGHDKKCQQPAKRTSADVTADVSSAVEGRCPAARKKRPNFSSALKSPATLVHSHGFIRRAGRPALRQAGCLPLHASAGANWQRSFHCLIDLAVDYIAVVVVRKHQNFHLENIAFEHCRRPNHILVPILRWAFYGQLFPEA